MNCQTFDALLFSFIHGEPIDSADQETFMAHAATCPTCGEQLATQRKLTNGLALLRNCTNGANAPARIEVSLRESFRRHAALAPDRAAAHTDSPSRASAESASILMFDSHKRAAASASLFQLLRRHAALVSATAAAVVIVAAASLSGNLQRETGKGLRATVDNNPSSERVLSAVNAETLITPLPNDKPTLVAATPDYLGDPAELIPVSALPPMPRNNGRMTFASNESPARTATRRERQSSRIGVDGKLPFSEIATEFLPLVEAESLASFESGQIVRVELPRQALIALGLPMNAERANEPVKADVLIGEDGLARAIRFVR